VSFAHPPVAHQATSNDAIIYYTMISFVWTPSSFWTPPFPLIPGNGGTETFTLGQARELTRRGIANQIVTFRLGKEDGRKFSPDVNFIDFEKPGDLGRLDDDVILVTEPLDLSTTRVPFVMLHNPPYIDFTKKFYKHGMTGRKLITNSRASARLWAEYLGTKASHIGVMHPFADACFGTQAIPARHGGPTRVLFAGRLTIEKGFYVFLEALHFFADSKDFEFTVVLAGRQGSEYPIIEKLVRAHPMLHAVPARSTPQAMAELLVTQDIVVMPSHSAMWREPFGILSVEAQHAGCRVVASDLGGLPETDCGGLHVFEPENPVALARTIRLAAKRGRLTPAERKKAATHFTAAQSVDELLEVLKSDIPAYHAD
jgi:D-inositol-3-phosphate glycosyltransferase